MDLPSFIQQKILRTLVRHLHFYLEVKRKGETVVKTLYFFFFSIFQLFYFFVASDDEDLEEAVLKAYGKHLHVAAHNRQAELNYLQHVTKNLLPLALHVQSHNCRSASPNYL